MLILETKEVSKPLSFSHLVKQAYPHIYIKIISSYINKIYREMRPLDGTTGSEDTVLVSTLMCVFEKIISQLNSL